MPKSNYQLFKHLKNVASICDEKRHYYCKTCQYYYSETKPEKSRPCRACEKKLELSVFFQFDIVQQLRYLLEKENICTILKSVKVEDSQKDEISDITDGSEYNRVNFSSAYTREKFDLTLICNTDVVKLKKRSLISCWPLMFTIAEIDEKFRNQFVIIAGIWCDETKPDMEIYLRPFCKQLKTLFSEGFSWTHPSENKLYKSRVTAPLFVLDAPARAIVQNRHNFKGKFGCDLCEIKTTKSTPVEGVKGFRYYDYIDNITYRTHYRMRNQGIKASRSGKTVRGLKGPCIITTLPRLDLSTSTIPEYMHSVLLGVVKQFLGLWFEDKRSGSQYDLSAFVGEIDSVLLKIQPPNDTHVLPRSIEFHQNHFKASELYYWVLFYSIPILQKYLPENYFNHWLLLVAALYTLLQKNIKKLDIDRAEILLQKFVRDMKPLYGEKHLSYNVHQLLHLAKVTRRWGPLWSNSCFVFENFNGFITRLIHGTKHLGIELVKNINIVRGARILKCEVLNKEIHSIEKKDSPLGRKLRPKVMKKLLGEKMIRSLIHAGFDSKGLSFFTRATILNQIFTSEVHKEEKTNSFNIEFSTSVEENRLASIICFFFMQ